MLLVSMTHRVSVRNSQRRGEESGEVRGEFIKVLTAEDYPAKRYEGTCADCAVTRMAEGLAYLYGYFTECVEKGHTVRLFDTGA